MRIPSLLLFLAVSLSSLNATAAPIYSAPSGSGQLVLGFTNLDIGGILYDVTFHRNESFNGVWGYTPTTPPMFWNDQSGAHQAATAVMNALQAAGGDPVSGTGRTIGYGDGFAVPYLNSSIPDWTVAFYQDYQILLDIDGINSATNQKSNVLGQLPTQPKAWTSFAYSVVPEPSTATLMALGMLGLGLVHRKRSHPSEALAISSRCSS